MTIRDLEDGGAAPAFIDRAITIIIHKTSKGFWHFLPYLLAKGTLVNLALQRAKKTRAFLAELGIKPESAGRVPESGRGSSAQCMPQSKPDARTPELFEKAGVITKRTGQKALAAMLQAGGDRADRHWTGWQAIPLLAERSLRN